MSIEQRDNKKRVRIIKKRERKVEDTQNLISVDEGKGVSLNRTNGSGGGGGEGEDVEKKEENELFQSEDFVFVCARGGGSVSVRWYNKRIPSMNVTTN